MGNKRLPLIDFFKGYSITTIVLYHLLNSYAVTSFIKKVLMFGGGGVHVFLLCSGFGLYLSYLKKPLTFSFF